MNNLLSIRGQKDSAIKMVIARGGVLGSKQGRVSNAKNLALLVVLGLRQDGLREILGASIAESEGGGLWATLFRSLKDRGLDGVEIVISDAYKGIQKAVEASFIGASWQRCQVHFFRAVLESIFKKDRPEIVEKLKEALDDEQELQDLAKELEAQGYSTAAETVDKFGFDLWN